MEAGASFLPATKFTGARAGYIFKKGTDGRVGYYRDDSMLALWSKSG